MVDRLIVNANIYTFDEALPRASALAIHRDQIVAVGDDGLRALVTRQTQVDDLEGATVICGLTDAHIHWEMTARALHEIDLFDLPSKAEAIARVAEAAYKAEAGTWLIGRGWSQAQWEGGAFPTAADLDPVTPQHPVFLRARSEHAAWVNSAALRQAGITAGTPDPADGVILRDESGAPTGILLEGAMSLVRKHLPVPSAAQIAAMMREAQTLAWRCGLTGLHDYDQPRALEALQLLHERGELGLRVVKNINDPFIGEAIRLGLRWGFGNHWLRLGGLKIFADGALGTRTALMFEPYENEPENCGVVVTDKDTMLALVMMASRAGFPSTIHAIGDRAVHEVLNVYEQVRADERRRGLQPSDRRHRIEHVQLIQPEDVPRLAALDVIASMQPIHATADYLMADKYWGARSRYAYNARLQLDHGARVAFGSDSPIEPFEPLKGIHAAVTRCRADGSPSRDGWYPEARLTVEEAVRGYTQGPAYAAGMESRLGKLSAGRFADLVALDRDIFQIDPHDLLKVRVVGTMTGGVWRYTDGLKPLAHE
ncbi:MAG: amidohydrolase [Aggregatilineales bacterium]